MPRTKAKTRVGRSIAGLGLFAEEDLKKGDFILEYTGDRISTEEADRRGGRYLFDVDDKLVLDGKDRKHTARYINHSCAPNAYAEIDEDLRRVFIYAEKKIKSGEEITYNYGKEYFEDIIGGKKNCKCLKCKKK